MDTRGFYAPCNLIYFMIINTRNLTRGKLNVSERANFKLLHELIKKLEREKEFLNTVGAHLQTTKEGTNLHISSFSSEHLSRFMIRIMSATSQEDMSISFPLKNIENLWSPTWTSVIILDHG